MFIKPIDAALLPAGAAAWQDHAGNTHFVLQSKKKDANVMRSLLSGFSTTLSLGAAVAAGAAGSGAAAGGPGGPSSTDAAYRRSLMDYDFRILLRFLSRKVEFVVAVDDSFEKIHTDWNWVERNLFLKLAEIDAASLSAKPNTTAEQIDSLLLRQFEEMTEEYGEADPQAAGAKAKMLDIQRQLIQIFPNASDDVLLSYYACTYWATDNVSARGQLCIGRNTVYYFGTRQPGPADQDAGLPFNFTILIPFKDISSLELVGAKRVLVPDSIQVGTKDKMFTFSLYFHRKEVFRIMTSLCNAAMNRLIKGAENSLSASSEMFSKNSSNMTGDLAISSSNKGGGLLIGRSREAYGLEVDVAGGAHLAGDLGVGDGDLGEAIQEQDFTDSPTINKLLAATPDKSPLPPHLMQPTSSMHSASSHMVVRYSHIKTALVNSLLDLDTQNKNMEFRNLFRLSYHETIAMEETPCYYFHKPSTTSHTGNLYLSQNFANFAAQSPAAAGAAAGANAAAAAAAASSASISTSMLFDSPHDPNVIFVIPYPHIVSIKKQPATALPVAGKLLSFSLSGYLVVSTKNRGEFWLAFSSTKTRDRVSEILLSRIRTVDWRFDDDVVIGGRNGIAPAMPASPSPTTPGSGAPGSGQSPTSFDVLRSSRSSSVVSLLLPPLADAVVKQTPSQQPLKTGLKFLVQHTERGGSPVLKDNDPLALSRWSEYFDTHGRDVCIVKDMRVLRDLLLRTQGVPERFRGDFWMLVSGAWYSKPESGYYQQLIADNQHRVSPFAEEIEKDVRRSLPEHPAYQGALGIDALRRLLTAFSWRNPAIGYAQALNIISAVLLLHLREEDAFWMLCMIVERMLPDHYTKTLVGSVVDQAVFRQLVEMHLPALAAHLDKLYMDLSTFSVPWFLCLFLNSVSLPVAIKLLDYFFLEGPKFLFWIAMATLKINEPKLIFKGKDDDIFVAILKDFFTRLGLPDSGLDSPVAGASPDTQLDISTATGTPLYDLLISTACNVLGPLITSETIESLRMRYRLRVVHQMEDTNRKSQVRTLCEQVALSFDEVSAVYEEVRRLEFIHGEEEEDPAGSAAMAAEAGRHEEEGMRALLAGLGGWGLVRRYARPQRSRPSSLPPGSSLQPARDPSIKSISLGDFRKVMGVASPWHLSKTDTGWPLKRASSAGPVTAAPALAPVLPPQGASISSPHMGQRRLGADLRGPSLDLQRSTRPSTPLGSVGPTAAPSILTSAVSSSSSNGGGSSSVTVPAIESAEDPRMALIDRIYFYCSFQYNFVQRQKRGQAESAAAARQLASGASGGGAGGTGAGGGSVGGANVSGAPGGDATDPGFVVDLAAMVHVLDAVMKQPLHSRLRFLFDLHDLDGDGVLSKIELKAVMDSFLEMLETSRQAGTASGGGGSGDGTADGSPGRSARKHEEEETYLRAVSSFLNAALQMGNNKGDSASGSSIGAGVGGSGTGGSLAPASGGMKRSASALPTTGNGAMGDDADLGGDLGGAGAGAGGSSAVSRGGRTLSRTQTSTARSGKKRDAEQDAAFRLSFNEFLLAVLSQSIFVQYFERVWTIRKEPSGEVVVSWQGKV
ncbi:hypothetical protein HK105_208669 [Polyrhizophydium stewartii]|uniref:Uncharacterized protein n=1 Tax=Polyrhizophydium stewartii TaxID=2732419 RepID=A0ABR4MX36_9FUNG